MRYYRYKEDSGAEAAAIKGKMETNGIIRRIDDLGRIVIPREYRKLHGIDLGDPMEITALSSGDILIKRVDTSGELIKNANRVAGAVAEEMRGTLLVCDFDKWLTGFGDRKNEFVGKPLTKWAARLIKERETFAGGGEREGELIGSAADDRVAMAPALSGGDCYGGLCIVSDKDISDEEYKLMKLAAKIIGEYMQKY